MRLFQRPKRWLPRTLFGRTLMILVTPVLLAQLTATFVFFDRHWSTMTSRLSSALAGEISLAVDMVLDDGRPGAVLVLAERVRRTTGLTLDLQRDRRDLPDKASRWPNPLRIALERALDERLRLPFIVTMNNPQERVDIAIKLPDGVLVVHAPVRRIYTPTTLVFIGWMIGSSIILSVIALLFMRNQIRPIRRLAAAAGEFGKGRDVPDFKPEGAIEVRQAATALLIMRDRLRRQITQRTTMLAGVSHDLRTPLTRMKLQLALMPESAENTELKTDVEEMAAMVEAYLAFVRGEEGEPAQQVDLENLLQEVVSGARKFNPAVNLSVPHPIMLSMRRQAMKRCLANLVNNAARFGAKAMVSAEQSGRMVAIIIDDNGPGIPEGQREEVFRPFVRLDESRNTAAGSVGLGLTIARDIARLHGGDVILGESPMGGLRSVVRLPV